MKTAATYAGDPRHHATDIAELRAEVERLKAELAEVELERDVLASRVVELEPSGSFRIDL